MNKMSMLLLFFTLSIAVEGREKETTGASPSADNQAQCQASDTQCIQKLPNKAIIKDDKGAENTVEVITVKGQFIGLQAPEVQGRFHLNKQFIDAVPTANGNINEVIQHLPGVQMSDSANDVSQLAEIRPQQIAISGAKPWQTGYIIDGMEYNSQLDPGAHNRSENAVNDVHGQTESMNISTDTVQSIDVYDSNIPAQYGDFSGGVVDVQSVSPFKRKPNTYHMGISGTATQWVDYHYIDNTTSAGNYPWPEPPEFEKRTANASANIAVTNNQRLLLNVQQLESKIGRLSLGQSVNSYRQNTNIKLGYSWRDLWFDEIKWSAIYAPYRNNTQLVDVLNSDFSIRGGALSSSLNIKQSTDNIDWTHHLSVMRSENSRTAPEVFYNWLVAKGKQWGQLGNRQGASREGGHGSLDKTQQNMTLSSKGRFNTQYLGASSHDITAGIQLGKRDYNRTRKITHYTNQDSRQYSTLPSSSPLNCSGYTSDCVALEMQLSLSELEQEIGRPLDLTRFEDMQLYSDNIITTPQYFSSRLVRPSENIDVSLIKAAAYVTDNISWEAATLNLGLRYDYDDFFQNHNIAPRIALGIDLFGNDQHKLLLGANRYYAAGLITYKLRESQKLSFMEYRAIQNGYLQGWVPSAQSNGIRYIFEDIDTPYNDEVVAGWAYKNAMAGTFSVRYVHRWQRDQLASSSDVLVDEQGLRYRYQDNSGSGVSERVSLSWHHTINDFALWANTSYSKTQRTLSDADRNPFNYELDDLVILFDNNPNNNVIVPLNYINQLHESFAPPLDFTLGISRKWHNTTVSSVIKLHDKSTRVQKANANERGSLPSNTDSGRPIDGLFEVYEIANYPRRTIVDIKAKHDFELAKKNRFSVTMNIRNLFNARTHRVVSGIGIEPGRQFWLGLEYKIN